MQHMELDVFPWIGTRPIKEIKAPEVLTVLKRVESRGALDSSAPYKEICGMFSVMQYPQDALNAIRHRPDRNVDACKRKTSCSYNRTEESRGVIESY